MATSLLPTLPASQRSFLRSEPRGEFPHDVIHHVEIRCRTADSTRLLRSIENRGARLTRNGLGSLSVLERLYQDDLGVVALHLSNYLRQVRGGRSDTRLRLQL